MIRRGIIKFLAVIAFVLTAGIGKTGADVYETYIGKFAHLAMQHQDEFGIPASITLAQGLLESSAGRSRLAKEGNNHFGIKCHNNWQGKTMLRNDDAPDECFRVYDSPAESFKDHSLFLKRDRYRPLFSLAITDYKNWALGLRKCGYATDPNYADKLVAIIERYSLYEYDGAIMREKEKTIEFIRKNLISNHKVRKSRGLHYVVAYPGDTYKSIAKEFGLKEKSLKEYNDAKSGKIKEWEEVYLEPKKENAPDDLKSVTIGEGENMRSISQRYGVKLSSLKSLNKKAKDRPGTILLLNH